MGLESEPQRVRASGTPTRCPFCHSNVDREREPWLACHACLAPHHRGCWNEGGACATCGETRAIGEDAPPVPAAHAPAVHAGPAKESDVVAVFEVELRGRNGHIESDASLALTVHPDRTAILAIRVRNETAEARKVAVRELPGWLRATGDPVEVPAGGVGELRLEVVGPALPPLVDGRRVEASLGLVAGEASRTVAVELTLDAAVAAARRRSWTWRSAVLGALVVGYMVLIFVQRDRMTTALAERGRTCEATVYEVQPRNHDQMYFSYEIGGVRHEKHDFASGRKVGDHITVTYLPEDPEISVIDGRYETVGAPGVPIVPFLLLMVGLGYSLLSAFAPAALAGVRKGERSTFSRLG